MNVPSLEMVSAVGNDSQCTVYPYGKYREITAANEKINKLSCFINYVVKRFSIYKMTVNQIRGEFNRLFKDSTPAFFRNALVQ